ncbi:MAG: stage III sporulation protein AA [Clostridiales bacterium]|nr:stage III sporulation protein AA [Clostridiales bacterium]
MGVKETILPYLSAEIARRLADADEIFPALREVRLRTDKPLLLNARGAEYAVTETGRLLKTGRETVQPVSPPLFCPSRSDISETLERLSRYSPYAFEEELRMGYITLPGGHRAGVAGQTTVVAADNGRSVGIMKHIHSINIRIAHQVIGCGDAVLPLITETEAVPRPLFHTMIISPPGCGKTTLLRDIVRQISYGGLTVGVVDERSEIAGCHRGVPQNDVGPRTDVLDGCPKAEGMVMLLRSMAPDVIAVDELGGERDARAVEDVLSAGVKLLCTAHGNGIDDVKRNPALKTLTADKLIFGRFVVLDAPGHVRGVYDGEGDRYAV